jgi:alkylated DNA repair dioxygenase AlkB
MIPGLYIVKNFLNTDEQQQLLTCVDTQGEWFYGTDGKQRGVQHLGAAYDYATHTVAKDTNGNPIMYDLPEFMNSLCRKISEHISESDYPTNLKQNHEQQPHNQAFISEYTKHYGILAHKDSTDYGDIITSISMGDSTPFVFEKQGCKPCIVMLEPGDLLIMTGEARYDYTHMIPYSKIFRWNQEGPIVGQVKITGKYQKFKRSKDYRRVSITMRHTKQNQL